MQFGVAIDTMRSRYTLDERDWKPMLIGDTQLDGFSWIPLGADESGAWESYWMRLDAGARSPLHLHHATELLYVADGVFSDSDGVDYRTGDVALYATGSRHASFSEKGCLVLVVTRKSSEIDE
ncbi:anti-sigma factor [Paraburkholderia sp. Cy-641]|uniref:cupin domain-containing protein n=1 Tax=Paraburkholderia sp. Cy-641 TaxID=2608337 RepID=UPI0014208989|nr:cupin domain-containing protein [Paraburkholderia sp. Cy-641]NIF78059.1 anti-sigma factor [Paraburkholderia sp. Cy-641]